MPKRSMWFWGVKLDGWRNWGFWWRQRVYIGVSVVTPKEGK